MISVSLLGLLTSINYLMRLKKEPGTELIDRSVFLCSLIIMIDPTNMFFMPYENFWKLWLMCRSLAFLKIGCPGLAFHIFKNLRLFDKKCGRPAWSYARPFGMKLTHTFENDPEIISFAILSFADFN